MAPLQKQYRAVVYSALAIAASVQLALYLFSQDIQLFWWLPKNFSWALNVFHVSIGPLAGYLLIVSYEHVFWKRLNPRFDFSGRWILIDRLVDPAHLKKNELAILHGEVVITESCTAINIVGFNRNADGSIRSSWKSTSCELATDGTSITMSLEHMRLKSHDDAQDSSTFAIEIIQVHEWKKDRFGFERPYKMHGTVYHAAKYHEKPFIVHTEYTRAR